MTTITNLVDQIDRDLFVHYARPIFDTPAASYTSGATTVLLATVDTLAPGAVLDAGFELMYVTAFNEATRTATVIRGFLGTTAVAGTTTTMVRINPRFPSIGILDTVTEELRSWDERLFAVALESLSFAAHETAVLASPTRPPYRLLYARPQPYTTYDVRTQVNAVLHRNQPTGQFATGYAVQIAEPFGAATTVDVAYALPFNLATLSATTELQATHGLTDGMVEVLKWGALHRMVSGKEAPRLDPQTYGRPDVAQAYPAQALLQAGAQYGRMRDLAYDREAKKLMAQWPVRFAG